MSLLPDEREGIVEELAKSLGMQRVGWVFTDLIPEDASKGTVSEATCFAKLIREYPITSLEIIPTQK